MTSQLEALCFSPLTLFLLLWVVEKLGASVTALSVLSRRRLISTTAGIVSSPLFLPERSSRAATFPSSSAQADFGVVTELPSIIRPYTSLAPLGDAHAAVGDGNKLTGQTLEYIASRLSNDLVKGSKRRGGYFVSGDLSPELFRDDCLFVDPTNSVRSLNRYRNALEILFDPSASLVELVRPLSVDNKARTIACRIRSGGTLKLPWRPVIAPYESEVLYTIGSDGLIMEQSQTWNVSAMEALRETFSPGPGASLLQSPKPSVRRATSDEPAEVSSLFEMVNGRRPGEYGEEERRKIEDLVDRIVSQHYPWRRELLSGTWSLSYLQPGPDGSGIDRRVPFFPELPFNDNFQQFTAESVTNVGQLLGRFVEVRVTGTLREGDVSSVQTPKRFVAYIDAGELCVGAMAHGAGGGLCAPLPISGEGLFDGVYLGDRLRIGQNLNGGGARVVQVKL